MTTRVRYPRSVPKFWMSAFVASDTRSPFSASRKTSACTAGRPSPAATRRARLLLRARADPVTGYRAYSEKQLRPR
ncbi:MAG TPA: hypothetical protein VGH53_19175 [Streptosporangiaceae bacterium]